MPVVYGASIDISLMGGKTQTLTISDGQINWNVANGDIGVVTLTSNATLNNPINLSPGNVYILIVKQDSTGNRTLSFGSMYKFAYGPYLSMTANSVTIFTFLYDGNYLYGDFSGGYV